MRVVVIIALVLCGVDCELKEPQCMSYYDYEHKLLYKLITIEEEVKKFRLFIDEMKTNQQRKDQDQSEKFGATLEQFNDEAEKQIDVLGATLEQFKDDAEKQLDDVQEKSNKVLQDLDGMLSSVTSEAEKLRKVPAIGFTLKGPKQSPTSGQMTFNNVITNVGDGFDVDSGVFTCRIPGYYFFSASLLKVYSYDSSAYCYIKKNGTSLVIAYTQAGHSPKNGYYSTTNSIYVQLAAGDTVTLAGCTALGSLYTYSSFSGFLITADAD